MSELVIAQTTADLLINLEKHRVDDALWNFPINSSIQIPLVSADKKENFQLDISRARIDLAKATYQNRVHKTIVLVRLDLGNKPHKNPDGNIIGSPHIHLYKEGFGDKWAYPLPEIFSSSSDLWQSLNDFMSFCNITKRPKIERGLFL
jgi:hypothetical protein